MFRKSYYHIAHLALLVLLALSKEHQLVQLQTAHFAPLLLSLLLSSLPTLGTRRGRPTRQREHFSFKFPFHFSLLHSDLSHFPSHQPRSAPRVVFCVTRSVCVFFVFVVLCRLPCRVCGRGVAKVQMGVNYLSISCYCMFCFLFE